MAGDLYYDNVSLLLHCDGTDGSTTFTDHSPTPKTVTAYGNAHIEVDQSKFSGASGEFVRPNDYLTVSHGPDLELGTEDFTIEFWFYPRAVSTNRTIWAGTDDYHYGVALWNSNKMTFAASSTGSGWDIFTPDVGGVVWQGNNTVSVNTWHHYAVTRSGNTWRAFLDGVLDKELTSTATIISRTENFRVGRWNTDTALDFDGYLEELRITKGVARYTADFTPPTEAFANYGSNFAYFAFAALAPYLPGQIETVLFGLQAFGLLSAPILAPPTSLALAAYPVELDGVLLPLAIEFRHAPLIPWIMPMTSPVYPPGVTVTLTNPTPGVSIRGLWSPADVLFGWSYDSGTDTISFPLASLFELTAAQADPATGDWRAILLAMSNTLWDAYIELDTAPQAMVLEYNPGYMMTAGPMVNTVKAEYTATVYLTFPEKFIADEP